MKSKHSDLSQRYMLLLKVDAINLSHRIQSRKHEYLEMFSLKRDRSVFKEIFFSRYTKATMFDLSHFPIELIEVIDDFYQGVDDLYWYLLNTQDMPNTIEDEITRYCFILEKKVGTLEIYIDAELTGKPMVSEEELEQFAEENFI